MRFLPLTLALLLVGCDSTYSDSEEPRDTTAPVITLAGANPRSLDYGEVYVEPGATAQDDTDGDLTASIAIDGAVDAPDTLGKMLGPEGFEALRAAKGREKDGLLLPEHVAETYWHLASQHRSVWTHELDLRAHSDIAWWNT